MTQELVKRAQRDTVQVLPETNQYGATDASGFWGEAYSRTPYLPAWGTRISERWLRDYDRNPDNTLWQGAASGLIKKFASTPSELKGGRNTTAYFDDVLRYSQFGAGQRHLKKLVARDYLRFDGGAYVEVIAPGNSMKPPTGRVTGLAHLDSFYCIPTGDPEYPVVYYDRKGGLHVLHHTRVLHFVDTPDGDQNNPGYGMSALRRAIAIVARQIYMGRYIVTKLDDKPPPGMLLVTGMTRQTWNAAWAAYNSDQTSDERPAWGKVIPFFGVDASVSPKIESVPFAQPPEKFDYKVYVELDVHELALAIGVDIQDLWELTSGNLGSAGQSEIQHAKSRGNTLGDLLSAWEQAMNNYVLPPSLEYEHKTRDPYEANERAQNAQTWASFLTAAGDALTAEEKRQILANQVEAVADAIIDENGNLIRLPDADRQDEGQQLEVTTDDATPNAPADAPQGEPLQLEAKAFADTATSFVASFVDLVHGAQNDDVARRRAGTVLRGLVARHGRAAYADGLKAGGVEDGLSDEDLARAAVLVAEQSQYVTGFLDSVYGKGLTDAQVDAHAVMWVNKSLQAFYDAGQLSADANGLYEWQLGATEKHCATCLRMAGQKHRLKEYHAKGILPKASSLSCGGWQCDCRLTKTTGRARGSWA